MNIGTLLPRHARYRGDHLALVVGARSWTFRQLDAEVNRLARVLVGLGLQPGQRVASVLPNCPELVFLYQAAARTGLVMVPASPLLQPAGLATLLGDAGVSAVLVDASLVPLTDGLRERRGAFDAVHWLSVGAGAVPGYHDCAALMAAAGDAAVPAADVDGDAPCNIMYSSGTTGAPKGIVHSHRVRGNYCTQFASAFRMQPESVVLHAGSLVFNGAMLDFMPWMFLGCTYILHASFDAAAVLDTVEAAGVTHIIMVPSQFVAIMNHPDYDPRRLESLQMIQNVGAPLLLEYKKRLNAELPGRFYELYGLTEGFMTVLDRDDALRKTGSVGCPIPFYEMRIVADDGSACAAGEVGEICGRGPMMMSGYHGQPELTARTIVDGWLHSGDAGYVDEDGFLYLVDRIKDMIISGGVNVYPRDIEEVVIGHPDVVEVAVFGVPDERWGEVPVAAVVARQGADVDAAALIAWTNQRVGARFQRIRDVYVMAAFPRNVAAKTLKRDIAAAYLARAGGSS